MCKKMETFINLISIHLTKITLKSNRMIGKLNDIQIYKIRNYLDHLYDPGINNKYYKFNANTKFCTNVCKMSSINK